MAEDEGLEPAGKAVLAGEVVVVVEVVDCLSRLDVGEVDVAGLRGPLEVEEPGVYVLILEPALLGEGATQLVVAPLHDVHLLVEPTPVPLLPSRHVDVLLPVFLLLFLLRTVHVHVVPVLNLSLLGQVDSGQGLGFVLQATELLISEVVELDPAAIFALAVEQFGEGLLDLVGLHGHWGFQLLPLQLTEVIFPAVEDLIEGDDLIAEVHLQCFILSEFGLDTNFVLSHEDLLGTRTHRPLILLLLPLGCLQQFQTVLAHHLIPARLQLQSLHQSTELRFVAVVFVFYVGVAAQDLLVTLGDGGGLQVGAEEGVQGEGRGGRLLLVEAVSGTALMHRVINNMGREGGRSPWEIR